MLYSCSINTSYLLQYSVLNKCVLSGWFLASSEWCAGCRGRPALCHGAICNGCYERPSWWGLMEMERMWTGHCDPLRPKETLHNPLGVIAPCLSVFFLHVRFVCLGMVLQLFLILFICLSASLYREIRASQRVFMYDMALTVLQQMDGKKEMYIICLNYCTR